MSNVKVAVRTRPLSKREFDQGAKFIVDVNGDTLSITNTKVDSLSEYGDSRERVKHFSFDYCYNSFDQPQSPAYASQEVLFQDLGTEVLEEAFEGYNTCVFAYGQTSTGKTYTMMGQSGEIGLIPRICEGLFARVDDYEAEKITFRVDISYLEIYNERVRDMLNCKDNERYTLKVREHPKEGPYVQDLSRHLVKDNTEIQTLLEKGNDLRVTASTHMHDHSSRSHAIITITFTQASLVDDLPSEIISKINLVDLAGSERADTTVKTGYKGRIKEGANINKSLVTLGNVIKSLAEKSLLSWSTESMSSLHNSSASETMTSPHGSPRKQRSFYIPYRDSVLTWLLKDSLGGNSKTIMIATISPASLYYSETLSTLRYAQRAKSIINKPKINEDPNVTMIREMKREIERLRQMLATAQMNNSQQNEIVFIVPIKRKKHESESDRQAGPLMSLQESGTNTFLFEKIQENEDKANQLTQTWLDKWQETQDILDESDLSIRRPLGRRASSHGVIVDSQLPHLIGMDDDILSTGVIIYHLKEGKTRIGREDASREQDIGLCGPCIQKEHCIIKNVLGSVTLYPNRGALCAVNGIDIKEPQKLTQGDVILLGKTHMFRFNHPEEAAKLREHRRTQSQTENSSGVEFGPECTAPLLQSEVVSTTLRPQMRMFTASDEAEKEGEDEGIKETRRELEEVREAQRQTEATYHEKEDTVYRVHEEHRAEIEQQKAKLALLIEEAQMERTQAEDEMILARQKLEEEREEHATMLQLELNKLAEIKKQQRQQSSGGDSLDITEDMCMENETSPSGDSVSSAGTPAIRVRKTSLEGKVKDLAQLELMQKWSQRATEFSLAKQEEELEDEFEHTQEQILLHQQKIKEIEDQYKATDASHYEEIAAQVKELNALQRKEEKLEMYLEEKQHLLKVEELQPQPLRGACSAEMLTEVEALELFTQKFSHRRGSDGDLPIRGYMFAADSSSSLNTNSKDSSRSPYSIQDSQSGSNMSLDSISGGQSENKSKDNGSKKISSRAQNVTDRLYKAPPNKPRSPKETKDNQLSKPNRDSRRSATSGSRDVKSVKPSPDKEGKSKTKPVLKDSLQQNKKSSVRGTSKSQNNREFKSNLPPKKVGKTLPNTTKKGTPMKSFDAYSPSSLPGRDRARSKCDSGLPSRVAFRPGFRLRQVSSASSLASVPEDEGEELPVDTVTQSETDITSAVVLRKRSRRLNPEEEYKRHSAPAGDKLASYNKIMASGLSLQQSQKGLSDMGPPAGCHFVEKVGPGDFVWTSHIHHSPHDFRQNVSDSDLSKQKSRSQRDSEGELCSARGSSGSIPVIVVTDSSDSEVCASVSADDATFQEKSEPLSVDLDSTDVSMNSSTVTIASTVMENPDFMSYSDDSLAVGDEESEQHIEFTRQTSARVGSKREHDDIPDSQEHDEVKRPKQDACSDSVRECDESEHVRSQPLDTGQEDMELGHSATEDRSFSGDSLEGAQSDPQTSAKIEDLEEANFEDSLELLRQPTADGDRSLETGAAMFETNVEPSMASTVPSGETTVQSGISAEVEAEVKADENSNSDFSVDSIQDAKDKLETLQEVLQQLKPKHSSKSSAISGGRRTRQRAYHRHHTSVDSDGSEHFSDDSLGSESNSKPSSRPGSASKRRRRPQPQNKPHDPPVKKKRDMSSEEYATSDSDGIYSDDSLTHSDNRAVSLPELNLAAMSESAVKEIVTIANSMQNLTHALDSCHSSLEISEEQVNSDQQGHGVRSDAILPHVTSWASSPDVHRPSVQDSQYTRQSSEPPISQSNLLRNKLRSLSRSTTNITTFDGRMFQQGVDRQDKKYNFVIHKDELNVVYNVQRTEYNTAGLRPVEYTAPKRAVVYTVENSLQNFPESIDITLTETSRTQREDKINSIHTEQVVFKMPVDEGCGETHVTERGYLSKYDSQYSQVTDGQNSRESSVEKSLKDETNRSFVTQERSSQEREVPLTILNCETEPASKSVPSITGEKYSLKEGNRKEGRIPCVTGHSAPDIIHAHSFSEPMDTENANSFKLEEDKNTSSQQPTPVFLDKPEHECSTRLVEFINNLPPPDVVINQSEQSSPSTQLQDRPVKNKQVYLPVLVAHDSNKGSFNDRAETSNSSARPVIYIGDTESTKTPADSVALGHLLQNGKQVIIPISLNLLQKSLHTENITPILESVYNTALATNRLSYDGSHVIKDQQPNGAFKESYTPELKWGLTKPNSDSSASEKHTTMMDGSDFSSLQSVDFSISNDSETPEESADTNSKPVKVDPSIIVVNGQPYLNFRSLNGSHVKECDKTGTALQSASSELHKTLEDMVKALKAAEGMAFQPVESGPRYRKTKSNLKGRTNSISRQNDNNVGEEMEISSSYSTDLIDSSCDRNSQRLYDGATAMEQKIENNFGSELVYIDGLPYIQIEKVEHVSERVYFEPKVESCMASDQNSSSKEDTISSSKTTEQMWTDTLSQQSNQNVSVAVQDSKEPISADVNKSSSSTVYMDVMQTTEHHIDTLETAKGEYNNSKHKPASDVNKQTNCVEVIVKHKEGSPPTERKKDVVLKVKGNDDILLTTEKPLVASVDHQVVRKELEKRIAKLEKHVGRVSDSAISSDYTDGENSTLSPKGSRMLLPEKSSASTKKVLFAQHDIMLPSCQTYTVQFGVQGQSELPPKDPPSNSEPSQPVLVSSGASEVPCFSENSQMSQAQKSFEDVDMDYLFSYGNNRGPLSPSTPDSALGSSIFQSGESGSSSTLGNTVRFSQSLSLSTSDNMPSDKAEGSKDISRSEAKHHDHLQSEELQLLQPLKPSQKICVLEEQQNKSKAGYRQTKGTEDQQQNSQGANFSPSQINNEFLNNPKSGGDSSGNRRNSTGERKSNKVKQRFTGPHRQKDPYTKSMTDTPTNDSKVERQQSRHSSYLGVETDSICNLPKELDILRDVTDEENEEFSISGSNSLSTFVPESNKRSTVELTTNILFTVFSSAEESSSHSSESDEDKENNSSCAYGGMLPGDRETLVRRENDTRSKTSLKTANNTVDQTDQPLSACDNDLNYRMTMKFNQAEECESCVADRDSNSTIPFSTTYEKGSVLKSLRDFMKSADHVEFGDPLYGRQAKPKGLIRAQVEVENGASGTIPMLIQSGAIGQHQIPNFGQYDKYRLPETFQGTANGDYIMPGDFKAMDVVRKPWSQRGHNLKGESMLRHYSNDKHSQYSSGYSFQSSEKPQIMQPVPQTVQQVTSTIPSTDQRRDIRNNKGFPNSEDSFHHMIHSSESFKEYSCQPSSVAKFVPSETAGVGKSYQKSEAREQQQTSNLSRSKSEAQSNNRKLNSYDSSSSESEFETLPFQLPGNIHQDFSWHDSDSDPDLDRVDQAIKIARILAGNKCEGRPSSEFSFMSSPRLLHSPPAGLLQLMPLFDVRYQQEHPSESFTTDDVLRRHGNIIAVPANQMLQGQQSDQNWVLHNRRQGELSEPWQTSSSRFLSQSVTGKVRSSSSLPGGQHRGIGDRAQESDARVISQTEDDNISRSKPKGHNPENWNTKKTGTGQSIDNYNYNDQNQDSDWVSRNRQQRHIPDSWNTQSSQPLSQTVLGRTGIHAPMNDSLSANATHYQSSHGNSPETRNLSEQRYMYASNDTNMINPEDGKHKRSQVYDDNLNDQNEDSDWVSPNRPEQYIPDSWNTQSSQPLSQTVLGRTGIHVPMNDSLSANATHYQSYHGNSPETRNLSEQRYPSNDTSMINPEDGKHKRSQVYDDNLNDQNEDSDWVSRNRPEHYIPDSWNTQSSQPLSQTVLGRTGIHVPMNDSLSANATRSQSYHGNSPETRNLSEQRYPSNDTSMINPEDGKYKRSQVYDDNLNDQNEDSDWISRNRPEQYIPDRWNTQSSQPVSKRLLERTGSDQPNLKDGGNLPDSGQTTEDRYSPVDRNTSFKTDSWKPTSSKNYDFSLNDQNKDSDWVSRNQPERHIPDSWKTHSSQPISHTILGRSGSNSTNRQSYGSLAEGGVVSELRLSPSDRMTSFNQLEGHISDSWNTQSSPPMHQNMLVSVHDPLSAKATNYQSYHENSPETRNLSEQRYPSNDTSMINPAYGKHNRSQVYNNNLNDQNEDSDWVSRHRPERYITDRWNTQSSQPVSKRLLERTGSDQPNLKDGGNLPDSGQTTEDRYSPSQRNTSFKTDTWKPTSSKNYDFSLNDQNKDFDWVSRNQPERHVPDSWRSHSSQPTSIAILDRSGSDKTNPKSNESLPERGNVSELRFSPSDSEKPARSKGNNNGVNNQNEDSDWVSRNHPQGVFPNKWDTQSHQSILPTTLGKAGNYGKLHGPQTPEGSIPQSYYGSPPDDGRGFQDDYFPKNRITNRNGRQANIPENLNTTNSNTVSGSVGGRTGIESGYIYSGDRNIDSIYPHSKKAALTQDIDQEGISYDDTQDSEELASDHPQGHIPGALSLSGYAPNSKTLVSDRDFNQKSIDPVSGRRYFPEAEKGSEGIHSGEDLLYNRHPSRHHQPDDNDDHPIKDSDRTSGYSKPWWVDSWNSDMSPSASLGRDASKDPRGHDNVDIPPYSKGTFLLNQDMLSALPTDSFPEGLKSRENTAFRSGSTDNNSRCLSGSTTFENPGFTQQNIVNQSSNPLYNSNNDPKRHILDSQNTLHSQPMSLGVLDRTGVKTDEKTHGDPRHGLYREGVSGAHKSPQDCFESGLGNDGNEYTYSRLDTNSDNQNSDFVNQNDAFRHSATSAELNPETTLTKTQLDSDSHKSDSYNSEIFQPGSKVMTNQAMVNPIVGDETPFCHQENADKFSDQNEKSKNNFKEYNTHGDLSLSNISTSSLENGISLSGFQDVSKSIEPNMIPEESREYHVPQTKGLQGGITRDTVDIAEIVGSPKGNKDPYQSDTSNNQDSDQEWVTRHRLQTEIPLQWTTTSSQLLSQEVHGRTGVVERQDEKKDNLDENERTKVSYPKNLKDSYADEEVQSKDDPEDYINQTSVNDNHSNQTSPEKWDAQKQDQPVAKRSGLETPASTSSDEGIGRSYQLLDHNSMADNGKPSEVSPKWKTGSSLMSPIVKNVITTPSDDPNGEVKGHSGVSDAYQPFINRQENNGKSGQNFSNTLAGDDISVGGLGNGFGSSEPKKTSDKPAEYHVPQSLRDKWLGDPGNLTPNRTNAALSQRTENDPYQVDSSNDQSPGQERIARHRIQREIPEDGAIISSELLSPKKSGKPGVDYDSEDGQNINSGQDTIKLPVSPRRDCHVDDMGYNLIQRKENPEDIIEPLDTNNTQRLIQDQTGNSTAFENLEVQDKYQPTSKVAGLETPASTSSDEGIGTSCQLLDHNRIVDNGKPSEFPPSWRADSNRVYSDASKGIDLSDNAAHDNMSPLPNDHDNKTEDSHENNDSISPRCTQERPLIGSINSVDTDTQLSDYEWVRQNRKEPDLPDWETHSSQLLGQSVVGRTGVTVSGEESESSVDEDIFNPVRGRSLSVATSDRDEKPMRLVQRSHSMDYGDYVKDSDGRTPSNDSITWVFIGPADQHNRSVQTEGKYCSDSDTVSADDESESGEPQLRHKYGIDDTMLPLSERTVSSDNLPRSSRDDIRRPHSSCGIMRNVSVESPPLEIDNIFPSKPPKEEELNQRLHTTVNETVLPDDDVKIVTRGVYPSGRGTGGPSRSAFLMEDIPALDEPEEISIEEEPILPSLRQQVSTVPNAVRKVDQSTSTVKHSKSKLVSRGVQSEQPSQEGNDSKEFTMSDTQTEDADWRGLSDLMLETNTLLRNLSERIPDQELQFSPGNMAPAENLSLIKIRDSSIQTSDTEDHTDIGNSMTTSVDSSTQTLLNESTQTDVIQSSKCATQTIGAEIASTAVQTHPDDKDQDYTIDISVQTDEGVDVFSPNTSLQLNGSFLSGDFNVDDVPDLDISTDIQSLRDEHDRMMNLLRRAKTAREARQELLRNRYSMSQLPFLEEEQSSSQSSLASQPNLMENPMELPAVPTFLPFTDSQSTVPVNQPQSPPKHRHINVINHVDKERELKLVFNLGANQPGSPVASIVLADNLSSGPYTVGETTQGGVVTQVFRDKTSSTSTKVTHNGDSDVPSEIISRTRNNDEASSTNERIIPIKIQQVEVMFPGSDVSRNDGSKQPFNESSDDKLIQKKNVGAEEFALTRNNQRSCVSLEKPQAKFEASQENDESNYGKDVSTADHEPTQSVHGSRNAQHSSGITCQTNLQGKGYNHNIGSLHDPKSERHILNSSDEFTQTDLEFLQALPGETKAASGSHHGQCEGGETHPTNMQYELERLQQERVEILELLSLNYLPSSLTIERLEAKLNYCIGQTDLILSSIEDTWDSEGVNGAAMAESECSHTNVITEDYIQKYKEDLAKSKKTIARCMDKIERVQGTGRGRTRTRTKDLMQMRRKAEIEAFKLERMREENDFGRTRSLSPLKHPHQRSANSSLLSADSELVAASSESSLTAAQIMSPRDHKEHLVHLRRKLVKAVEEDEHESLDRSYSPDAHWVLQSLNSSFRSFSSGPDYSSSREVSPEFRASDYLYNFDGPSASSGPLNVYQYVNANRALYPARRSVTNQPGSLLRMTDHRHLAAEPEKLLEEFQEIRQRASSEISEARKTLSSNAQHHCRTESSRTSNLVGSSSPSVSRGSNVSGTFSISKKAVDEELEKMRHQHRQNPPSSSHYRYPQRGESLSLTRRGSSLPGRPSRVLGYHRPGSADYSYLNQGRASSSSLGSTSYHSYNRSERDLHQISSSSLSVPKRSTFDTRQTTSTRRPQSATTTTKMSTPVYSYSPKYNGTSERQDYRSSTALSDVDKNKYSQTRPVSSSDIKSRIQSKGRTTRR